jgi:hypothetical protein
MEDQRVGDGAICSRKHKRLRGSRSQGTVAKQTTPNHGESRQDKCSCFATDSLTHGRHGQGRAGQGRAGQEADGAME